jgi:hypothetical protein
MNRDGLPIRSAGFEALAGDFAGCDHPIAIMISSQERVDQAAPWSFRTCVCGRDIIISKVWTVAIGRGVSDTLLSSIK